MQLKKVVNWRMMKQKYSTLKRCTERINWIISQRFWHFCEQWTKTTCHEGRRYWLQKIVWRHFSCGFNFLKKYATLYMFLKKVVANTISINIANNDQGDFVFNLMKGYNVSSFLKKCETNGLSEENLFILRKEKQLLVCLEMVL